MHVGLQLQATFHEGKPKTGNGNTCTACQLKSQHLYNFNNGEGICTALSAQTSGRYRLHRLAVVLEVKQLPANHAIHQVVQQEQAATIKLTALFSLAGMESSFPGLFESHVIAQSACMQT